MSFSIGAGAFGLDPTQNGTPASDIVSTLNPGFQSNFWKNFSLRMDALLSPGVNLQYYGGGGEYKLPWSFPSTSALSSLQFGLNATFGIDRIVPATGPSTSSFGILAGGHIDKPTSTGLSIRIIEVDVISGSALHNPNVFNSASKVAVSGSVSYFWGGSK